jgi:hypothetical protein
MESAKPYDWTKPKEGKVVGDEKPIGAPMKSDVTTIDSAK